MQWQVWTGLLAHLILRYLAYLSKWGLSFSRLALSVARETGGSGLGLSIVHDTVKRHGGSITVGPNKPQGSIFSVSFPRPSAEETGI